MVDKKRQDDIFLCGKISSHLQMYLSNIYFIWVFIFDELQKQYCMAIYDEYKMASRLSTLKIVPFSDLKNDSKHKMFKKN